MKLSSHSRRNDEIEQREHGQTKTQRRKRRSPKKTDREKPLCWCIDVSKINIWNFLFFYTSYRESLVGSPLRKPGRRAQLEHITSMMPKHEAKYCTHEIAL